jgi:alpha/beta superfamily hydrolase
MAEALTCTTADGVLLEAELAGAVGAARARCVLCHPHPRYGGSMRSLVTSALFQGLPEAGVTTLRFNFRGVERSGGAWDDGRGEQADVVAAIEEMGRHDPGAPLVLAGWSFGADMALATVRPEIAGWFAVAPPLRYTSAERVATDPRPKVVVLAEHDEVRDAAEVAAEVGGWPAATVEVVAGASHFFVGRTDRLVELALGFVDRLTS